jgi:hypothetical protein
VGRKLSHIEGERGGAEDVEEHRVGWQSDRVVRWPGGTYIKYRSSDLLLLDGVSREINQSVANTFL